MFLPSPEEERASLFQNLASIKNLSLLRRKAYLRCSAERSNGCREWEVEALSKPYIAILQRKVQQALIGPTVQVGGTADIFLPPPHFHTCRQTDSHQSQTNMVAAEHTNSSQSAATPKRVSCCLSAPIPLHSSSRPSKSCFPARHTLEKGEQQGAGERKLFSLKRLREALQRAGCQPR